MSEVLSPNPCEIVRQKLLKYNNGDMDWVDEDKKDKSYKGSSKKKRPSGAMEPTRQTPQRNAKKSKKYNDM